MLRIDQIVEIKDKRKTGLGIEKIAKQTHHGKRVVKQILDGTYTGKPKKSKRPRVPALEAYKPALRELFEKHRLSGERMHEHAAGMGYEGSKRSVRRFRLEMSARLVAASVLTVRYETPPGKQAQCDWFEPPAFTWNNGDGTTQKVYGFEILLVIPGRVS